MSTIPGRGHQSFIQLAPESTWGAVPSGQMTARMEMITWDAPPAIGVIRDPNLSNRRSRRANYQGTFKVKGSFTVRISYEGYLELLRGISGGYSTTAITGGRDHFFIEAPTTKSYQIEVVEGDIPVGKCSRLNGVKLTSVTLKIGANDSDGMVIVDVAFSAKDMLSNQTLTVPANATSCSTAGTITLTRASGSFTADGVAVGMTIVLTGAAGLPNGLTVVSVGTTTLTMSASVATASGLTAAFALPFPPLLPVLFHQASTVGWVDDGYLADGSIRVQSAEVMIEAPHDEERHYLGSQFIDEQFPSDFLTLKWKFVQELVNMTVYDACRAFTAGSPKLLFQDAATFGSSSHRELEMRSNVANIVDLGKPVRAYGKIFQTTTLEATFDTTDASALFLRVRNTEAVLP